MDGPGTPPRVPGRSWAPALLAGHGALAVVLLLVTLVTALVGGRLDATPGPDDVVRAAVLVLALAVVVGTALRVGRRRPGVEARWSAVVALWVVVPWAWAGLWVGGSSPAALSVGVPLLGFFWWPFILVAGLLGAVVATVLAAVAARRAD